MVRVWCRRLGRRMCGRVARSWCLVWDWGWRFWVGRGLGTFVTDEEGGCWTMGWMCVYTRYEFLCPVDIVVPGSFVLFPCHTQRVIASVQRASTEAMTYK